jgi:hypothetical protein
MIERDYRYDVNGLQASSQRHAAAGRPRPLPEEWRDKERFALAGLAGSRRQGLNFGVEQMGAADGHHRAAFACFAIEFRATQAYKDVATYKDVFS